MSAFLSEWIRIPIIKLMKYVSQRKQRIRFILEQHRLEIHLDIVSLGGLILIDRCAQIVLSAISHLVLSGFELNNWIFLLKIYIDWVGPVEIRLSSLLFPLWSILKTSHLTVGSGPNFWDQEKILGGEIEKKGRRRN